MTLSQKLLLGFGGLVAFLYLTGTANASTGSAITPGGGGAGGGTVPNSGDTLTVATSGTYPGNQLFIRSTPMTLAAAANATASGQQAVGQSNIVAIAQQNEQLTASGQVQTMSDGSVWWGVSNSQGVQGWADSAYLHDQTTAIAGH